MTGLAYGVIDPGVPAARLGDEVLPLDSVHEVFRHGDLNTFLAAGPATWEAVHERVLSRFADRPAGVLPLAETTPRMPFAVADYVDFYSSEHHASNLGQLFRPGQPPLLPNWKHLPVGYHGRSGTVVVSGTDVTRPTGQRSTPDGPSYGPSRRLDIEAEVGFVVGVPTPLGSRVSTGDFREHVFGVVLVNDWSARDIQAWEYQPLGPFLGKSFATSISAWVTPLATLDAARTTAPPQDPPVLDYLREAVRETYDITLTVELNGTVVSRPPFAPLYWTPAQQLAHLTVNGASLRTGDLYASGTVSGPERSQVGSLLELSWGGAEPITLGDGSTRTFLEDGDVVTIRATAAGVELGEVTGRITPAH